jgi:hypothetical protein
MAMLGDINRCLDSCELQEHVEEVRTRNEELSRLVSERPLDSYVLDAIRVQADSGGSSSNTATG